MKEIAQQLSFHPSAFTLHPSFFILSRRFGRQLPLLPLV
jgi:hypothetical protein